MMRTRNFVLLLLSLVMIALAVGITSVSALSSSISSFGTYVTDSIGIEREYSAEVPSEPDTREERIATLRAKIAERLDARAPEAVPPQVTEPVLTDTVATTTPPSVASVELCSWYSPSAVVWVPNLIQQENREGMRVYYEAGPETIDPNTGLPIPSEVVRARIPLRTGPGGATACLASDVIGVAIDGSLIRNNETALYTVFGGDTLIGYALDGFPIYGVTSGVTPDQCGGVMVGGAYRYVLAADRPGLITCFSGPPITLR